MAKQKKVLESERAVQFDDFGVGQSQRALRKFAVLIRNDTVRSVLPNLLAEWDKCQPLIQETLNRIVGIDESALMDRASAQIHAELAHLQEQKRGYERGLAQSRKTFQRAREKEQEQHEDFLNRKTERARETLLAERALSRIAKIAIEATNKPPKRPAR